MMRYLTHFLVLSLLLLGACNNEDKKAQEAQKPTNLYLDYQVSAEEDAENVIILLQFRNGDAETSGIALEEGSIVTFDGELVPADSAKRAGVYYELQRPLSGFAGEHVIVFKDEQGQTYEERFTFNPLQLTNVAPVVSRANLNLSIKGINDNDTIQVMVTDTSFQTADINEDYNVTDGRIAIGEVGRQQLASGPIHLELHKEESKALANGRLLINYTVRRDLELKD